jgi:hypothetical protein
MTKRKRLLVGLFLSVGLIGMVAVGAGVWFFFGDSIGEHLRRRRFDALVWKSNSHTLTNAMRIRMVDDLLRRYNFRGMTREQATAIIGEPDKTDYFKNWDMVYWLGPERGWISIDSEWLVLRIDNQNKISDYRIVTD